MTNPMNLMTCPKCSGEMELGFVPDRASLTRRYPQLWFSGELEAGLFGMKLMGRATRGVVTYRCTKCGYLESYAK